MEHSLAASCLAFTTASFITKVTTSVDYFPRIIAEASAAIATSTTKASAAFTVDFRSCCYCSFDFDPSCCFTDNFSFTARIEVLRRPSLCLAIGSLPYCD